jgi:SAM-dependent methyltransferase
MSPPPAAPSIAGAAPLGAELAASYDRLADESVKRLFGELDDQPFDRDLLDRFAQRVRLSGPVLDLGCGPGQVARFFEERGVEVAGVDISAGMIRKARELNPELPFIHADMRALALPEQGLVGMVALDSIIHTPLAELGALFAGWRRLLRPRAPLLLAFRLGEGTRHLDVWWGHPVALDLFFFTSQQIEALLAHAGFGVTAAVEREPYAAVEFPGRRAYLLAEAA